MHHNLLLAWLATFINEVEKKAANQQIFIFLYLFFLYTTLKLYKYVLYNICFC